MSTMVKVELSKIGAFLPSTIDLHVTCASFEKRCLSLTEHVPVQRIKRALVCETDSLADITSEYSNDLRARFGEIGDRVIFRRNSPLDIADKLQAAIGTSPDGGRRILVDITTFTHEALLILIRFLQTRRHPDDQIFFGYTMATDYSVGLEGSAKWLSKGISEIRSVLGYPGEILPSRRVHLIILAGFETERSGKLVDEFEPGIVSLGFVTTLDSEEKHLSSTRAFQEVFLDKYAAARTFRFPCYEPASTRDAILAQVALYPDYNAVVAAMNTKMSTFGAALAAGTDERIQLCYAFANEYNYDGYSAAGGYCYIGDVTALLHGLSLKGMRTEKAPSGVYTNLDTIND